MRILIVEDDAALGSSTARGLELEGLVVDWRQDGPTAEAALVSQRFDAIVLDLGLPGTSGEELLRNWRNAGNVTPVLVLTARGFVLDRGREPASRARSIAAFLPSSGAVGTFTA